MRRPVRRCLVRGSLGGVRRAAVDHIRAYRRPLVAPDSQVIAVTIVDLWDDGALPELAALGVSWMAFMTCIAGLFYYFAQRCGLTVR